VIDGKIEQTHGKDTITKEDVELQSQNEGGVAPCLSLGKSCLRPNFMHNFNFWRR
jgi:hypothetical protein